MSNLDNLNGRELLYRAYQEIHDKNRKAEQKGQPVIPLNDEKKVKKPLDYLREGYAEKETRD